MQDLLPDLCDQFEDKVQVLDDIFHSYGGKTVFYGQVETVSCFEDNSKVREVLSAPGEGKVLVVDGQGSRNKALLGDQLALLAIKNGWQGVVIHGCARDIACLAGLDLGVKALGAHPCKTEKKGLGTVAEVLRFASVVISPGDYLYADLNGILISPQALIPN